MSQSFPKNEFTQTCQYRTERIEAFGTKGMLQAENRSPVSTVLSNGDGLQRPTIEHSFPSRYRDAYRIELETFIDCVQNGTPTPVTYEDVRMSFLLCELAENSYREGNPLEFQKPESQQ